jgi:hypothetical protein
MGMKDLKCSRWFTPWRWNVWTLILTVAWLPLIYFLSMAMSIALMEKAGLTRNLLAVDCFNNLYAPARWCETNSKICGDLFQGEMNLIAAAFGEQRDNSPRKRYTLFHDPNTWIVWRMNRAGIAVIVKERLSQEDAERLTEESTARNPAQTYWAEPNE